MDSHFSRAGKASLSKFKILLDKEKILRGEPTSSLIHKSRSVAELPTTRIGRMVAKELEQIKLVNLR
jgi:hypothetical protein